MYLPQWLLKALRRVLHGHAGGRSPLKAILFLWRFFRHFFRRFSRAQDDGEPDKPPRHIVDQVSYLPQGVESTTCTMSLAVDDDTDESVMSVVCRSTALPNDPRISHDGHLPLHGSCPSSITPSPIEGSLHLDASSKPNPSRLSEDTGTIALNSATDAHLNSSHAHLPSARSTSGENSFPSDSGAVAYAVVTSLPVIAPWAPWHGGQNENNLSTLSSAHPFFVPVFPGILRKCATRLRNPHHPNGAWIAPLTTSFTLDGVPSGWSLHVNTAGARYYVHEKMFHASVNALSKPHGSLLRIFTFEDTVLPAVLQELTRFLDNIISYMHTKGITLPSKVDLVMSFGEEFEDGTHICTYYFADHMHCSIFWVDGFNADMHPDVKQYNTSEPSHLAHAIEAEYWLHSGLFPMCQEMTGNTIEEVNDFLIHSIAEKTWDPNFDAAQHVYTLPELQQYFSILNSIRNSPAQSYSCPGLVWTVALILEHRSRTRYVNFYAEPGPFLGSTPDDIKQPLRTMVIVLLSPLLFFAPDIHHTAFYEIWCKNISPTEWSAFIWKLSTEWQDFVINATVLLNVNIAFLAIQSIDNSSSDKERSPAQIASYVSTILSVGSISLGLLLLQKYRHKNRRVLPGPLPWEFLGIQKGDLGQRLGLETLAIMFSLPWALLMWAMIFFLAAFCLMCFTASSLLVRMTVGSALLAIGILIFWYLTISRERYELRWYVRAHVRLIKAWSRLPRGLSTHKFNMGWMKRMPWMSPNDVEMAPTSSHTMAAVVNDGATTCSHKTTSVSSYETALASSHSTMSLYDTASMRSHATNVDVV
ncbi:hypothetical protein ARMGADRAFT_979631 [Armillaria gallica]|uniref:WW domain-containing protein n=1 Tax=Armillaria gallica TaxID=47427 RepID=A0A2H3ELZ7_ARMGA|nr:hypothetical protein ARMGADRAFT_979631 [Armillaria gallica]